MAEAVAEVLRMVAAQARARTLAALTEEDAIIRAFDKLYSTVASTTSQVPLDASSIGPLVDGAARALQLADALRPASDTGEVRVEARAEAVFGPLRDVDVYWVRELNVLWAAAHNLV